METRYAPQKDIVVTTVDGIKTEIKAQIGASEGDFVIDLSGVEMVDSKGIGLIISTFATLSERQRGFRLVGAAPDILELFRSMRMNQHFSIE